MPSSNKKEPDNIVHALVIASRKIVDTLGKDLQEYFIGYRVTLLNIIPTESHAPDAITLVLAGKQIDIKNCLVKLKQICYEKELGLESSPMKSLPPSLKGYLSDMEDSFKFEKIFSYCSKEYLNFCKEQNITPHPEVIEAVKD